MNTTSTYGVTTGNGDYIEVSNTEQGAKNYATRHGYNEVYERWNMGYHVSLKAVKINNTWKVA